MVRERYFAGQPGRRLELKQTNKKQHPGNGDNGQGNHSPAYDNAYLDSTTHGTALSCNLRTAGRDLVKLSPNFPGFPVSCFEFLSIVNSPLLTRTGGLIMPLA